MTTIPSAGGTYTVSYRKVAAFRVHRYRTAAIISGTAWGTL
jgi:hypothetical protein